MVVTEMIRSVHRILLFTAMCVMARLVVGPVAAADRPNILLAIADDQSWQHTSASGYPAVLTLAFDRVCKSGVLFNQCIAGSPGCSPSRAALLTGRHHWQLAEAGTHASSFPSRFQTYPDLLEQAGYFVGYTGKGWGPGNWKAGERSRNPAGDLYEHAELTPPNAGISKNDYAANFGEFLKKRPKDKPFCFWYGGHEPHRLYAVGSDLQRQKRPEDANVPPYLPDAPEIRKDLLDYCVEIEWFDQHLGKILDQLKDSGELDNTLVIVTADNGMSFPRAKANCYEYGIHVPLAISWPKRIPAGRVLDDLVGFVDLTATILDASGVAVQKDDEPENTPVGKSLMNILAAKGQGILDPTRTMVFAGRERHSSARYQNVGYPQRVLRTQQFLYIKNFHPERWPAGDPQDYTTDGKLGPLHGAYRDIDAGASLAFLVKNFDVPPFDKYFHLAVDKRPAEELFDIQSDPGCLKNLAMEPAHAKTLTGLRTAMNDCLKRTGDPRAGDNPEVWETYPRFSPIRQFPVSP